MGTKDDPLRVKFKSELVKLGDALSQEQVSKMISIHENDALITHQVKELCANRTVAVKRTKQLQESLDKRQKKLNLLGDLQNWAEIVEKDLGKIEALLDLVEDESR